MTELQSYLTLSEAARKYGVSRDALTRLARDGIIRAVHSEEGTAVITVSTVAAAADVICKEIRPEQYEHLRGRPIRVTKAAEQYGVSQANLSRWADAGYIRVIERRRRLLLLDEADVKLAADIFKRAYEELQSSVRAGWVLKRTIEHLQSQPT
jgi:predicted site-specific integrase-resolvase